MKARTERAEATDRKCDPPRKDPCLTILFRDHLRRMPPVYTPPEGGQQVNVLGIPMLIRIHGRDTQGTLSAVESHDLAGGGPPLHIHHREDETFQILEGHYEFTIGDQTVQAPRGSTLFAPRGVPHTYRFAGPGQGRLLCVITPAGFEGFFAEIGSMSADEQADIPRLLEIASRYGLEIVGP